ncbi:MAG: Lsm family RNA-binding protein [Nitrososphaerota archaeon]|nr:Lsm family RNA-binding protein [Candidatus Bathyarchaeota archaeon]MDW8048211.1 Lsm family RNA-binding protein [Nitrososphaerota archaeon]
MSVVERRFTSEVTSLIDKTVTVITLDNKTFTGVLVGINPENLSLVLADAKNPEGAIIPRVIISGATVAQILSVEKVFDLKGLAERLERVFPRMVKLYEKEGFIWVMDRIKVTQNGVIEGSGPAAEKVQNVYEQFVRETQGI